MTKRRAEKVVVKPISSISLPKEKLNEFMEDFKCNRFLPEKGEKFNLGPIEILLLDVKPVGARITGSTTEVELITDDTAIKEEKTIDDDVIKKMGEDVKVTDFLDPELLGDKQRTIVELINDKLDGKDIPMPPVLFLLGPPSTSKTKILKSIEKKAKRTGWKVKFIDGPTLNDKYHGETAKMIMSIKEEVEQKFVLLIDEVDSIVGKRNVRDEFTRDYLFETVTSLNLLLDEIIDNSAIAIFTSNAGETIIDDAILNRSLPVLRDTIGEEKVKRFIEMYAKNPEFDLSADEIEEIQQLDLSDFREAEKVIRLKASGLRTEEAKKFLRDEKEKDKFIYHR